MVKKTFILFLISYNTLEVPPITVGSSIRTLFFYFEILIILKRELYVFSFIELQEKKILKKKIILDGHHPRRRDVLFVPH